MRIIIIYIMLLLFAACDTKDNTDKEHDLYDNGYFVFNKRSGAELQNDIMIRTGGNILPYNQPSGVHYAGKHSRTYMAWLNHRNIIELGYYDDRYKRITHYSELFGWPYKDDHGQPVLHIKNNGDYIGHVYVFSSLHNSRLVFTRANKPESITGFTPVRIIDNEKCTYPSVVENSSGDLMLFYTKNIYSNNTQYNHWTRNLCYRTSTDGGDTWSGETELLTAGTGTWIYYVQPVHRNNIIHIAFSVLKNDGGVYDVHYIKSDDRGKTWTYNDSTITQLPVMASQPIYQSPDGIETRAWDIKLDEVGAPVIAYQNHDNTNGTSYVMYDVATNPKSYFVTKSINSYYPAGIVIDERNTNKVYASAAMKNGYNAIVEKIKGKDSFVTSKIVSKETNRHQMRPQTVKNYNNVPLLWVDEVEYKSFQDYKTNLKAYITNTRQLY